MIDKCTDFIDIYFLCCFQHSDCYFPVFTNSCKGPIGGENQKCYDGDTCHASSGKKSD